MLYRRRLSFENLMGLKKKKKILELGGWISWTGERIAAGSLVEVRCRSDSALDAASEAVACAWQSDGVQFRDSRGELARSAVQCSAPHRATERSAQLSSAPSPSEIEYRVFAIIFRADRVFTTYSRISCSRVINITAEVIRRLTKTRNRQTRS